MLRRKMIALIMALAMVMSAAVFIYAEDANPGETEPVAASEAQETGSFAKEDQIIKVPAEKTVIIGRAFPIKAILQRGDGKLTYASSNVKVATVKKNGTLKAKSVGETVITVRASGTAGFNPGETTVTVKVVPKKVTVTSLTSRKKGRFTVKWKKLKGVDGFEIAFCKDKAFSRNVKVKHVKNGKAAVLKNCKTGKKTRIYVKVRTYKTVDGVKYYSDWSKAKAVKIK